MNHALIFTDGCNALSDGVAPDPTVPTGGEGTWWRRELGASVLFKIPFFRDLCLWLGLVDASRSTAEAVLERGGSLFIYPGGEAEQIATKRGEHHVVVKRRRGFLRLALRYGAGVVPGYAFGEVDLYTTSSFLIGARRWLVKSFGVALPIFAGRWWCPLLPSSGSSLCLVWGRVLDTKKVEGEPSKEAVDALQARYEEELTRVFSANKRAHGLPDDATLVIR